MPKKSPILKRLGSRALREVTSRYPRLKILTEAIGEVAKGPPIPSIDSIIPSIPLLRSPLAKVRLNAFQWSINPAKGWAGNMMVTELFESLVPHFELTRMILLDKTNDEELSRFPGFKLVPWGEESDEPKQVVSMVEWKGRPLPVGANDLFCTNYWSRTYTLINEMIPWQCREFGQAPNPMIYLIQDYEPGFYPWSTEYALAESTYHAPNPVVAVFSSSILQDFFREQNYVFTRQYSFEPKLNPVLLANHYGDGPTPPKKRQILIYGRPWVPRNGFALLVAALKIYREKYPDAHRWNIISRGEDHPEIDLGDGMSIRSVGRTSFEQYAQILRESSIGMSLMVSPHPSFPPMEMALLGIWAVTNGYGNKDLSRLHENLISVDDIRPETLADQLIMLCRRFEADPDAGYRGKSHMPHYLDDTPMLGFTADLVEDLLSLRPGASRDPR